MPNSYTQEELRALVEDITDKVSGESDLDWAEICTKHGDRVAPDTLRKAGVGLRLAMQAGILTHRDVVLNSLDADDIITPTAIQRQLDDIYKAKRRLYDQRREYNKNLTIEARWEHLADELRSAAQTLPPITYQPIGTRVATSDSEAVLFLSDWHFGLVADNAWNKFNEEIFRQRIEELRTKAVDYLKRHSTWRLHIVILGDMVEGVLRPSSQVESSELGCSQIMRVSEELAQLVGELSTHVNSTQVYSTWGNHGRTVQKYTDSVHADNMERIIPWWMKERLSKYRTVEFKDGFNEFIRIDACGKTIAAVHGDLDTKKGLPSVSSAIFYKEFGVVPSYVVMGHVHHASQMDDLGTVTLTVGSLSGTDSYANGKRLYSTPNQTMLFFTEENGMECRYDIGFSV